MKLCRTQVCSAVYKKMYTPEYPMENAVVEQSTTEKFLNSAVLDTKLIILSKKKIQN